MAAVRRTAVKNPEEANSAIENYYQRLNDLKFHRNIQHHAICYGFEEHTLRSFHCFLFTACLHYLEVTSIYCSASLYCDLSCTLLFVMAAGESYVTQADRNDVGDSAIIVIQKNGQSLQRPNSRGMQVVLSLNSLHGSDGCNVKGVAEARDSVRRAY
eukprot:scaffold519_cov36-Prasinocladus_malaysianus.AAC.2